MERAIGVLGLVFLVGVAFLISERRKAINLRPIWIGLFLQFLLAVLILGIPSLGIKGPLRFAFDVANDGILAVLEHSERGAQFLFGDLAQTNKMGFIFAFQVLPTIIFMASLMAVAYHLGLMQIVVKALAWLMQKTLKISGAESLSTAANIFVGQTEAPLLVRPYVETMTRSELFCIMVGGMANTAGGVLAAYVGLLKDRIPDIAGHLLTMSVMSAPATIVIAKLMIPEQGKPETLEKVPPTGEKIDSNVFEAAARGAGEGLTLALNVAAMLLAFIALISLLDAALGNLGELIGFSQWAAPFLPSQLFHGEQVRLSFELILGIAFSPLAFLMGIPWHESLTAGIFLGEKIVLNEFVAYVHLAEMSSQLSDRTMLILSYALCGFANFSSIAIQIGGIGGMAPNRRGELARLGIRSIIGGSLATFLTATIAGIIA